MTPTTALPKTPGLPPQELRRPLSDPNTGGTTQIPPKPLRKPCNGYEPGATNDARSTEAPSCCARLTWLSVSATETGNDVTQECLGCGTRFEWHQLSRHRIPEREPAQPVLDTEPNPTGRAPAPRNIFAQSATRI